ncbi:PiggyBac transposable element-derived protein 4 [Merluccius polli]|uniref:PiggyBac transposable element-derived protein 4 n=1 Tax=Merluccius polli TaxID=89951 RepID=A0AA47MYF6_MERPO|nr:PiggyBac transposable element-derived protein 4 [Merluccius polli]
MGPLLSPPIYLMRTERNLNRWVFVGPFLPNRIPTFGRSLLENPEHNEVEEAIDEDSESEEEEKMDEVTDATCRPHADSSSELASTSSTTEEEGYEVEDWSPDEEVESADEEDSEAEMEEMSEVEDYTCYDEEESSTDEEEMEEEDAAEEEYFQSNYEKLIWSSTPPSDGRRMLIAERAERETSSHGPTAYARSWISDIKSTFELFLPKPIEQIVLNMTNKEGRRVYGREWKRMDGVDLQAYVGMLILAGVYRSSKEATSSLWHAETGRVIFRATMTLKIFHTISRVIRFDDKETEQIGVHKTNLLPLETYGTSSDVTVDERLVPFRGRCPFKQYIPTKPGKYGIKIWAACDARSSYAWNMQIYTGKPAGAQSEKNQGMRVVLDMTAGLQGKTITCDNFFTSYALGLELLKRKLFMVGTVRRNKPELPPALVSKTDRARFSSKFVFTETHALVSYHPKKMKNVLLMSTLHRDAAVSNRDEKKPMIIQDYNHNKGGVDNLDKVTSVYTCKRMTARWPLVVFFNILDVSAYNSFVLLSEINPDSNQGKSYRRRLFMLELGRQLVIPRIKRRKVSPRTPAAARYVEKIQQVCSRSTSAAAPPRPAAPPGPSLKRGRCKFCPRQSDVKTLTICKKCNAYICKDHVITTCLTCN